MSKNTFGMAENLVFFVYAPSICLPKKGKLKKSEKQYLLSCLEHSAG